MLHTHQNCLQLVIRCMYVEEIALRQEVVLTRWLALKNIVLVSLLLLYLSRSITFIEMSICICCYFSLSINFLFNDCHHMGQEEEKKKVFLLHLYSYSFLFLSVYLWLFHFLNRFYFIILFFHRKRICI
jgi:hypothetical protein